MKDDEKKLGERIEEQNRATYAADKFSMLRIRTTRENMEEIDQRADS
jgi:hypothetical protein